MPNKRKRPTLATHAEVLRLRREVQHLRTLANATALVLNATRREFQNEIENLKKLFLPSH